MASHSLVSGLPRVFLSLPPSLAPPCTPCVAGRLRATPHSSSLRSAIAPFQTLHLDVWGPAPTLGPEREHYFLVVVDDYSRYTMVFPQAKNSDGCLALVRDTSADKLSARAIPCVFLGFPVGSPDYSFYHQPLHQFLDSRDFRFDESVSYYTRYPCQGLPVPPPPLFLAPSLPPAPAPPVPPPPPGPAPSGLSHATALPSVARQVASPSLQSSSQSSQQPSALSRQFTVDLVGVGAGGAAAGDTRSGGARLRGARVGGAGAGGSGTGGASSRGAGAGGAGTGGASSGGAGAGGTGTRGASCGGAGAGGTGTGGASSWGAGAGGAGTEETGAGGSPTTSPTARPHRHDTRFQALCQLERKEQERVEQERHGIRALGLPSSPPVHSQLPTAYGPTFPPPDSTPPVFSPSQSRSSPHVFPHDWTRRCPPRARTLSPLADLCTVLFCSPPHCSPLVFVLPSPPESSLIVSSHPITDYYCAARLIVSCVLASLVTDPRASLSSASALTAAVADFASTRLLDYATRVVAAPPPRPLSVEGESALGCDVLEDRQFEMEFFAAVSPPLYTMVLSLKRDPDALDIPTPCTYREAVSGKANVVDGLWLFKVNQPPGSPPVFKARYVARGFSQPHRDYELHSLDFSIAFLQGRLHEENWLRCPPGFTDTFPPGTQWSLRRPVYGLRQLPREWHDTIRSTLRDLGFLPSYANPSLFVRVGSTPFFILVYVLRWFGFQFSTTQPTPLAVDHRLTGPFPDEPFESSGPYAELVGYVMYLMTCTRPDLAFPLSVLSHLIATGRHRPVHWTAAVRVAKIHQAWGLCLEELSQLC
ncbi:unnamed protein product [Closterium sp. NIES-53]